MKLLCAIIILLLGASYFYKDELVKAVDPLYTPNDPVAVANDYWIVYLSNDAAAATKYTSSSAGDNWIKNKSPKDRAILGTSNNVNGIYYINTDLLLVRERGHIIPLYTVVTSVNGSFKVDEFATFNSIHDAAMSRFTNQYLESIENGSKLLNGDIVSQLNKADFMHITKTNLENRLCETALTVIQNIDVEENNIEMCLK